MAGKVRNKTKSAAKKRFLIRNSGSLKRKHANKYHKNVGKPRARKNRLGKVGTLKGEDRKTMMRLVGKEGM